MKTALIRTVFVSAGVISLSACVVAPMEPRLQAQPVYSNVPVYANAPVYGNPNVYIAPTYAMPAPGYAWGFYPRLGWGWSHPRMGFHSRGGRGGRHG